MAHAMVVPTVVGAVMGGVTSVALVVTIAAVTVSATATVKDVTATSHASRGAAVRIGRATSSVRPASVVGKSGRIVASVVHVTRRVRRGRSL